MASNVNVKFIAILSAILLALTAGVAAVGYLVLTKSAEDHIIEGDRLVAEANYEDAVKSYSKAVSDVPTNVDYLRKWRDALLNTIPETDLEYSQSYTEHYMGILRRLAALESHEPSRQRDMLDAMYEQTRIFGANAETWTNFINTCDSAYESLDMETPDAQSLRRYRGFGRVHLMNLVALSQDEHDQAIADLEAAIEADPEDIDALIALADLHRADWLQAMTTNRPGAIATSLEKFDNTIDRLTEAFPEHPRAIARQLEFDVETRLRQDRSFVGQMRIRENLRGAEEPLVESLLSCDTDLLNAELLINTLSYGRVIWNCRMNDFNQIGLQVTERVLEARPDDFDVRFFRGVQLMIASQFDEAHEMFQTVIDTPDRPISLDGLRLKQSRINALFQQANNALAYYSAAQDEETREEQLALAADLHERLADKQGADSEMALMIGGRLAMAEKRYADAVTLLQRLSTRFGGNNLDVIRMLARALAAQGTLGAAIEQYDRWIELDDTSVAALREAAQIDLQLKQPQRAITRLEKALHLAPNDTNIQSQLNTLQVTSGNVADVEARDAVIREMLRAESLANSDDEDGVQKAIAVLDRLIRENPDDPRPLAMITEYLARSGDVERALQMARKGQKLLPSNDTFNRYVAMLSTGDRVEIALDYIDRGADSEPVKLVKKHSVMKQSGDEERAAAFLAEAERKYPNHPTVLDALFIRAIQADDLPAARAIANRAAEHNADQADGLLYRARLQIKQENYAAALSNLELAVEKASLSPQAWRLYGQVLLRMGRIEEAVSALARAYNYKPDDSDIAKTYASTLMQLQRHDEALNVVRNARKLIISDDQLNEMWLALESQVGDAELAVEQRRTRYINNPDNAANTRALISLLTDLGRFDEAGELIQESLASGQTDLGLTIMQARWHAQQGSVDEGVRLIETYIAELDPDDLTETPFMALGNFLVNNGRDEAGIEAFKRGAEHQSMDAMSADRRLGDYYFSTGRFEDALQAYQRVTSAGADETGVVAKRVIETLQRLERWDDAEKELDKLAAGSESDVQTMLLRAEIALGRGDTANARSLVNRAVEAAPNKPEPYIRRAQLEFNDPERLSFVLSDLAQAIRLNPTSPQPRLMRARVLIRSNRSAEAISELRRAIEAMPNESEFRRTLIQELWESGRRDEAHAAARRAIEANPENPAWLTVAGDIASRDDKLENNWTVARQYFERAYEIDRSTMVALRLANACLYETPPDWQAALDAIDMQGDLKETDSRLLILRARAINIRGDQDASVELAEQSLAAAESVDALRHWFLHMEVLFEQQGQMIEFVDRVTAQCPERLLPAYAVHAAAYQAYDFARHPRIIESLYEAEPSVIKFADQDGNPTTLVSMYRVLGQLEYRQENFEKAADAWDKGLRLIPDDLEFNNNLAYTRAKYLDDLEGALAPAEMAVELAPANSAALDTLGWIYYRLGRIGQAKQRVTRAIDNAENPIEKGGAYLHMAMILLAEGNRPEARKFAEQHRDVVRANPNLESEFKREYDELMTQLEEAENTR